MNLPSLKLGPKPKAWDLVAVAVLGAAAAGAVVNWFAAQKTAPGTSLSGGVTLAFVLLQAVVATAGLMVLGKTAKQGTLWGNLASLGALLAGLSGVLLAAALWIAA
jgi:hypothetical protein